MWVNLRRDIVELFLDAQMIVVELSVIGCARRAGHRRFVRRESFNARSLEHKHRAKQRAKFSNFVVPVLPPPEHLVCSCGYSAHTPQQLGVHRHVRKCT